VNLHNDLEILFRQITEQDDLILHDDMAANATEWWDSLAHINLMVAIEETFGIAFALEEYSELQDVRSIKRALNVRMDSQGK
jgi:acyl carrier protein